MANLSTTQIKSTVLSDLFPTVGTATASSNTPIWMSSMKVFKVSEFTSEAGYRYMKALRFSDNMAVEFSFSFWNSRTYINDIEVYRFNDNKIELIDCRKYDKQDYTEDFVKQEVLSIVRDAAESFMRLNGQRGDTANIEAQVVELVEGTYRPLKDYNMKYVDACVHKALASKSALF